MSHIITVTANTNQFGLISGKQYKATEADAKCYSVQIGTVGFESIIAKRFFGVSVYNSTLNIDNITATTPVTFNQYYTLLANHDWFYTFSDSSNVYSLGERREGTLNMLAKRHEFAAYLMAHFSLIRHDAIVAPTGILQQSMTLVELKATWDAMPRVALHLNGSVEPAMDVEHYESIKVCVGDEVTYSGVPMFASSVFTVESINGVHAVVSVPHTKASRNGNAYTVSQRYTVKYSALALVTV